MQFVYAFHMPLFFCIAGYFISDKKPFVIFVREKAKRLFYPYGVSCAGFVILNVLKNPTIYRFLELLYIAAYGCGNGQGSVYYNFSEAQFMRTGEIGMFWYVWALFWGLLMVKASSYTKVQPLLILVVSLMGICSSKFFWLPFSLQNGMAVSFWTYLGYLIKRHNLLTTQVFKSKKKWFIAGVSVLLFSASVLFGQTHLYRNYYGLGIIDVLGAISGCVLVYWISCRIASNDGIIKRFLVWCGRCSFLIYSIHFLEDKVYPVANLVGNLDYSKNALFVLSFVLTAAFCLLGCFLLQRLSIIKKLYAL